MNKWEERQHEMSLTNKQWAAISASLFAVINSGSRGDANETHRQLLTDIRDLINSRLAQ